MAKNKIYPFAVASVRAMENKLLTKQKLMQMAEAKNAEEALRLLADTDYGKTQVRDVHDFEEMIQNNLEESYESIQKLIPNETFMNIFLFKNDYHNIKVLIKEEISDVSGRKFMVKGGTLPIEDIRRHFRERNYSELPYIGRAVEEAIDVYAKTKNGRYVDTILDKACFRNMTAAAKKLGNEFVIKYIRRLADVTNLKTLLRIRETRRSEQELLESIVPGGELDTEILLRAFKSDSATAVLKDTAHGVLCESYMDQGFTVFEKACDDYLMDFVKDAKYKTLTPEPVVAYILAKETEAKCVRIIMTCKLHDIDEETIKERVREAYV